MREIAQRVGVTEGSVRARVKKLGLAKPPATHWRKGPTIQNPVVDGQKLCSKCDQTKAVSQFRTRRDRVHPASICRDCDVLNKTVYYKRNGTTTEYKRHARQGHLRRKFGLTEEKFLQLLQDQGGKCAICGISPDESTRRFHVDHCHTTGAVRGILCFKCNSGLGSFDDKKGLLRAALSYLDRSMIS
jgi:hypothetical protein